MFTSFFTNLLGGVAFLFFFWRRLKEDYASNQIFSTGLFMVTGITLGFFLAREFFPSWWFWVEGIGALLGLILGIYKFEFRFFESLEAAGVSFLPWVSIIFLTDSTQNASLVSLIAFLVCLALMGTFFLLDMHYKKFTWYRSGRVGFAGISTMGVFFFLRALSGAFFPNVVSFSGKFDAITSGVVAFVFFLLIYNLSKKEI